MATYIVEYDFEGTVQYQVDAECSEEALEEAERLFDQTFLTKGLTISLDIDSGKEPLCKEINTGG